MNRFHPARTAGAVALAVAALAAAGCDRGGEGTELRDAPEWTQSPTRIEQLGDVPRSQLDTLTAARLSGAFRAAADVALPSVVFVQVELAPEQQQRPLFRFFGVPEDQQEQIGSGSGFVFDSRGYILTNNHVVQDATSVLVRLVDGREYRATVVGRDEDSDVAVIRIEPHDGETLPTAQIGDSADLKVGDWVLALGSPFDLDFTVTAGIVSAKGRNRIIGREDAMALESFIQTDAAINPGNSGGPLVDLLGRVVGINTAIYSPSGVYTGYGFAIPVQLALRVARDLVRYGVVHRPQLGVSVADVAAADADYYGLGRVAGALVKTVAAGSPAARAGLEVGDVVLGMDSTRIADATQLIASLAQHDPGDRVTLTFYRDRRMHQVDVRLAEFEREPAPRTASRAERTPSGPRLDFTVTPLPRETARRAGYDGDGVLIRSVEQNSAADARGVLPGMILYRLNGTAVASVTDVERVLDRLGQRAVLSLDVYDPELRARTVINYRPR